MSHAERRLIANKWQSKCKRYAKVQYITSDHAVIPLVEDTEMCDGIGGIIWEGSIVLCEFLQLYLGGSSLKDNLGAFEVGAGTGLSGIVSAMCGVPTIITDRYADLAEKNVREITKYLKHKSTFAPIGVRDYSWGDSAEEVLKDFPVIHHANKVIYGAEIACLMKQHDLLVDSIQQLADQSPSSVVFITFDGSPADAPAKYKSSFLQKMKNSGFASAVVFTGSIEWQADENSSMEKNRLRADPTHIFPPPLPEIDSSTTISNAAKGTYTTGYFRDLSNYYSNDRHWTAFVNETLEQPNINQKETVESYTIHKDESIHHIIAFFKMSSMRLCSRCNRYHFVPIHNRTCRFHSGFYVCRQHPAELKLSVDGLGDSLGYYGTGEEWRAHFWDCCGDENQQHPGCRRDYHQQYK